MNFDLEEIRQRMIANPIDAPEVKRRQPPWVARREAKKAAADAGINELKDIMEIERED